MCGACQHAVRIAGAGIGFDQSLSGLVGLLAPTQRHQIVDFLESKTPFHLGLIPELGLEGFHQREPQAEVF